MFHFRKMNIFDKKRAAEISLQAWEDDYIPKVFEKWVNEEKGEFTAVEHEDKLIGYGKMTIFSEGEVWLEGLRKDLTSSVKGMAKALTEYYLEKIKKIPNLKSVRFATYFGNTASIRSNEAMGFQKIQELSSKTCDKKPKDELLPFQKDKIEKIYDEKVVFEFLQKHNYFEKCGNFILDNWKAYGFSEEILNKYIVDGNCYGFIENNIIKALIILSPNKLSSQINIVAFAFENKNAGEEILRFLHQYINQNDYDFMETIIPDIKDFKELLQEYGFYSWERENDFYIYEFPLNKLT